MDQEDIAPLHNELRRISQAIAVRQKHLTDLVGAKVTPRRNREKNKRYSTEMQFTPGELIPQANHFVVDKGTIFRPMSLDWALRVNMTDDGTILNVTPGIGDPGLVSGATGRNALFSFMLAITDTGSNREWQNAPVPDVFLLGGILSPFYFERAVLSADTLVSFEVQPILSSTTVNDGDTTLNTFSVIIGMSGHEEVLNG